MDLKSLLLIWRDKNSGKNFHIGTLSYDGILYTFEYTAKSNGPRKVKDAMKCGYRLLPVFQEIDKIYQSKQLFPTFHRRIPSSDRVDYDQILSDLQLSKDADSMDILRKTRGIISGNPYRFEETLNLNEATGLLSTSFYINGMRYQELPSDWEKFVKLNVKLKAVPNSSPHDANAVELWTEDDLMLGFVPAIYTQAIRSLIDRNIPVSFVVDEKRPNYDARWWVHVAFKTYITLDGLGHSPYHVNLDDSIMLVA